MGQRQWLGSHLIRTGRLNDALFFAQAWLTPDARKGISPPSAGILFKEPSQKVMPIAHEEGLAKSGPGSFLYTAALASFKLYGDCPQSRQYLKLAAKAQPNVLIKVLGRIARPGSLGYLL